MSDVRDNTMSWLSLMCLTGVYMFVFMSELSLMCLTGVHVFMSVSVLHKYWVVLTFLTRKPCNFIVTVKQHCTLLRILSFPMNTPSISKWTANLLEMQSLLSFSTKQGWNSQSSSPNLIYMYMWVNGGENIGRETN